MTYDRFKHEEAIMDCWNILEDVNTVFMGAVDCDYDEDTIANALLGINALYKMKFDVLWRHFEASVAHGHKLETKDIQIEPIFQFDETEL